MSCSALERGVALPYSRGTTEAPQYVKNRVHLDTHNIPELPTLDVAPGLSPDHSNHGLLGSLPSHDTPTLDRIEGPVRGPLPDSASGCDC